MRCLLRTFFFCVVIFFSTTSKAQTFQYDWANVYGTGYAFTYTYFYSCGSWSTCSGTATSYSQLNVAGSEYDASGNLVAAGDFNGNFDADPGAGTTILSTTISGSSRYGNVFFAKYSVTGALVWAKALGNSGSGYASVRDFKLNADGSILLALVLSGSIDMDPGAATVLAAPTGSASVIAKYDASGNYVWHKIITTTGNCQVTSLATDPTGNIIIAGDHTGTTDFDPSAGVFNLTASLNFGFIAKYTAAGVFTWAGQINYISTNRNYISDVQTDALGSIIISGEFTHPIDIDPGAGTVTLTPASSGLTNAYFAKYASAGTLVWGKQIEGTSNKEINKIAVDGNNDIVVAGYFYSTMDLDPGAGTSNFTSLGGSADLFLAKYDANGIYKWGRTFGSSTGSETSINIKTASSNTIFLAGTFSGIMDIDAGTGTTNLTPVGNQDIFMACYDVDGAFKYASNIGSADYEEIKTLSIYGNTKLFIGGQKYNNSTLDFDPGAGVTSKTFYAYEYHAILAQYTFAPTPAAPTVSVTQPTCQLTTGTIAISAPVETGMTYSVDGTTYQSSATFSGLAPGIYNVYAKNSFGNVSATTQAILTAASIPAINTTITAAGPTTFCPGGGVGLSVPTVSGYTYLWSNGATTPGITASTGGSYSVAVTASNCSATSTPVAVTVNTVPTVNTIASQSLCHSSTTTAVTFSGAIPGTVYNWTNSNTAIGLAASGAGNISAFTATNTTNAPTIATITVTPSHTSGGVTCSGASRQFTITVNPRPVFNSAGYSMSVCNNTQADYQISNGGNVAGATYNWTNSNTAIGLGASGSTTDVLTINATNTGTTSISGTITVTPVANGCTGAASGFVFTVKPTPTVNAVGNQVVCAGSVTAAITFAGAIAGTAYSWTNTNTAIGLGASGIGNIPAFLTANGSTSPITATIQVTPSLNGCNGTPKTFTITVNPLPAATLTYAGSPYCAGAGTATPTFSGTTGGVYSSTTGLSINPATGIIDIGSSTSGTYTVTYTIAASGGCAIYTKTASVTIKPVINATITPSGSLTICQGGSVTLTAPVGSGITYLWSTGATTSSINAMAAGTYSVAVTSAGCTATSAPVQVTVNGMPTVNAIGSQEICNGGSSTAIVFSGSVLGTTYSWTNSNTSIGLPASGLGTIGSFTATNGSATPIVATITVTPSYTAGGTTCSGTPVTFTITVNPTPAFNPAGFTTTICNNQGIGLSISNGGNVTGATYNWTNSNTAIGLAASGSGDGIAFTGINTGVANISGTITVTPSANGCAGVPASFVITVKPTPVVNPVNSQSICTGGSTAAIVFSSAVAGTSFNWNNSNTSIGLAASGTGSIASFIGVNNGTSPVSSTITVTPVANGCTGTPVSFTITVNPQPSATLSYAGSPFCAGTGSAIPTFSGTAGGTYSSTTGLSINSSTGAINIGASTSGTYVVTYTVPASGSCAMYTATTNVTINPPLSATINASGPLTLCAGGSVTLSVPQVPGNTYSWSNGETTSSILVSTAGSYSVVVTSAGCTSNGGPVIVSVNPVTTVAAVANQTVCNGGFTASINLSGGIAGTVYSWTNNTTSIGLAASGTGNISSFNAINTSSAPVNATITVTPSYTNGGVTCTGSPVTFAITVNPTPTVNAIAPQTVCNGAPVTAVSFSGAVSGTVYSWTNSNPSIGLLTSGIGNIASFMAVNTSGVPQVATVTVTPSYTNNGVTCSGAATSFTITVNPTPTVNSIANQTVCAGSSTSLAFNGAVNGTVYTWTNSNTAIGLPASGNGNISAFPAANTTSLPITATVTVTPSYTNNGVTCAGSPSSFTITVNPTLSINAVANQTVCNGAPVNAIAFSGATSGTVYYWTNSEPSVGLAASGTGNIAGFNAINAGNSPRTATIIVTPSYTNGGTTCVGAPVSFTITVNPTPTVAAVSNQTLCNNSTTSAVSFTGTVPGTVYSWTNSNPSIGLSSSGTGVINAFAVTNTSATTQVATITVTPAIVSGSVTCTGTPVSFTITVHPTPVVNTVANASYCAGTAGTSIVFTGAPANTTYTWTASSDIGFGTSGTGLIPAFTASNSTNAPLVSTVTVTPVSNGCTGTPQIFTIGVNPATVITNQPVSQTVCAGGGTSFSVAATGIGLSYQWYKDGVAIPGATNSSFSIASTSIGNAGLYYAIVTGSCGNRTSNSVTLAVNISPAITTQPVAQTICPGAIANFSVTATGSGLTYQWKKNGVNITGANSSNFSIVGASAADAADYTVSVIGLCSPAVLSNVASLTVNGFTTITAQPVPQTVCIGAPINLSIAVTGNNLVYQWRKDGTAIPGATASTYHVAASASGNAGIYDVLVTGACGPVISTPVTVTVNAVTSILTQPANQMICLGANASFSVTAAGVGLSYQWRKNGVVISNATLPTYNIINTIASNAGTYDVMITGTCGTITSNPATLSFQTSGCITSIPNINPDIQRVMLLPNIVRDRTILRTSVRRNMKIQWTISDGLGRAVKVFESQALANQTNDLTLSLGGLAAGVYYLNGVSERGRIPMLKLVKQ